MKRKKNINILSPSLFIYQPGESIILGRNVRPVKLVNLLKKKNKTKQNKTVVLHGYPAGTQDIYSLIIIKGIAHHNNVYKL